MPAQHIHRDGVLAEIVEQLVHGGHHLGLTDVVAGAVGVAVLAALCQMLLVAVIVLLPVCGPFGLRLIPFCH